ncbi:MAG: hypothetical protein QOJ16_4536 [Acidobacteriota bacterium]|jgi:hypothetical protein|nr:hypothetical protein [Acidobacteriota bacterium]
MTTLIEITAAMETINTAAATIPVDQVRHWLSSSDIEVMGAAYSFIMKPRFYRGIVPPLTLEEYKLFLLKYYERCFREDPVSDWASSRYSAGWDLANWLEDLWKQGHQDVVREVKEWLAALYQDADPSLRECIVNATLEHVLSNRGIARLFNDWTLDPVLKAAYEDALPGRKI